MGALTTALPSDIADDDAAGIVAWAGRTFGSGLVLTASFEDPVLVHLVATHAPGTPIVVLDPRHKLAEEFEALYDAIVAPKGRKGGKAKR